MKENFDVIAFEKNKQLDEHDLNKGMAENASLLGYYVYQQGQWKTVCDNLKLQIRVKTGEITLDVKASGEKADVKKVEAMVATNSEIIALEKALLKALEEERSFSAGVEAMKQRGQMLQSIGSNKRAEMDNSHGYSSKILDDNNAKYTYYSGGYAAPASHETERKKMSDEAKKALMEAMAKKNASYFAP